MSQMEFLAYAIRRIFHQKNRIFRGQIGQGAKITENKNKEFTVLGKMELKLQGLNMGMCLYLVDHNSSPPMIHNF